MQKIRNFFATIISSIIPNATARRRVRGLIQYGIIRAILLRIDVWRHRNIQPRYRFAICAIAKDEGPYFAEWIFWHTQLGADHFYIYDNESTDNTRRVLAPFIKSGLVEYTALPGAQMQLAAYSDCLARHRFDAAYIAFIDLDEFLVPQNHKNLPDFMCEYSDAAALEINWLIYGSNHHKTKSRADVMARFTAHAHPDYKLNRYVKSIVNPRHVVGFIGAHEAVRLSGYAVDTNHKKTRITFLKREPLHDKIRINHYAIKSRAEFLQKRARGRARPGRPRDSGYWEKYDQNDITD